MIRTAGLVETYDWLKYFDCLGCSDSNLLEIGCLSGRTFLRYEFELELEDIRFFCFFSGLSLFYTLFS